MLVEQAVPEGLAGMPPGPELSALLAGLDLAAVSNDDIVEVMIAQSRQVAFEQARLFAAMNEVIHCRPFAGTSEVRRGAAPDKYAADEVRAALSWTRRAAEFETDLAFVLLSHLPLVHAALLAGEIDRPKACVFARHLADLSAEQVEVICRVVVPRAPGWTTGQIAARLLQLIIQVDPAYYERRYRKAVRDRQVCGYLDRDGTAVISGSGLPVDEARAALERVDVLARAARQAGHPGTVDQVRADVFLRLLDGSLHGLTRDEIIDALIARCAGGAPGDPTPAADGPPDCGPGGTGGAAGDQRVGIEVRVGVSTLLGRDEHPGEVPGWGPVPASVARAAVLRQRRAQWRWGVVDAEGRLVSEGLTRRRPHHLARTGPGGGVVELHIPESLLMELSDRPDAYPGWAGVIADIAAQHAGRADHLRDLDAHPGARFPRAGLRRHTQIRDRTCVHKGCRAPARGCDQDHTRDYVDGGPTTVDDLAPVCRHDHMLKTEGGWLLDQPEPGVFVWTSPLGRTYRVCPEPISPLSLDPLPRRPEPWSDDPAEDTDRPLALRPRGRHPPRPNRDPHGQDGRRPHPKPTKPR